MRFQDWPERLNKILADSHNKPFEWGVHDCCLFAADVVMELTGTDPAADLRGAYTTALEAARIVKERGGARGIATASLGEEIPPLMAGRGDIVMIVTKEHGDTMAVCTGMDCVAPGVKSLQRIPMTAAVAAWRVI